MFSRALLSLFCLAFFGLISCSDDDYIPSSVELLALDVNDLSPGSASTSDGELEGKAAKKGSKSSRLIAKSMDDNWDSYSPGGETACAGGGKFSFFVNRGTVDKVIIDFLGGGACWDAVSCQAKGMVFKDSINGLDIPNAGIYDRNNPNNPFKDWTHVVIPYCTGDIHWGSNDQKYTFKDKLSGRKKSFVIKHRGAVNASAVLDWVKDHYKNPDNLMVAGCSAGAYGSIYWAPHVQRIFPNTPVHQFADSGAGVITEDFSKAIKQRWRPDIYAPRWIASLNPQVMDWGHISLNDLYMGVASQYPGAHFAQYSTKFDFIQSAFYARMNGGDMSPWSELMLAQFRELEVNLSNFSSYVSAGSGHCVLDKNEFYTKATNQVRLSRWLADFADDKRVESVECTGCDENKLQDLSRDLAEFFKS